MRGGPPHLRGQRNPPDEAIFRGTLKDDRGSQVKIAGEAGHGAGSGSKACDS